jgi:hypothetical protein
MVVTCVGNRTGGANESDADERLSFAQRNDAEFEHITTFGDGEDV